MSDHLHIYQYLAFLCTAYDSTLSAGTCPILAPLPPPKVSCQFSVISSAVLSHMWYKMTLDDDTKGTPRIRSSLFPNVPPYHVFLPPWKNYNCSIIPALKEEEWQFPAQIMPVVRDVVEHAGFKITKVRRKVWQDISLLASLLQDCLPLLILSLILLVYHALLHGN